MQPDFRGRAVLGRGGAPVRSMISSLSQKRRFHLVQLHQITAAVTGTCHNQRPHGQVQNKADKYVPEEVRADRDTRADEPVDRAEEQRQAKDADAGQQQMGHVCYLRM